MKNKFFEKSKNYVLAGGILLGLVLIVLDLMLIGWVSILGSIIYYFESFKKNILQKENKYANDHMIPNEKIIFLGKLSPIIFIVPLCIFIITILIQNKYMSLFTYILLFIVFMVTTIAYYTTEFEVTNKRIIKKSGWLKRAIVELNYEKIEKVYIEPKIFGRLFNYGTLNVFEKDATESWLNNIENPLEFENAFLSYCEEVEEG